MTPLHTQICSWLGTMATGELAEREKHYPGRVANGRMSQEEADTAIRAWRAMAELFARGATGVPTSWAELEHEASRTFLKLDEVTEACTDPARKPDLEQRRGAVQAMLDRIRWHQAQATARPSEGRAAA